ncbi:hypothetical protein [Devosia sp. RR2S18]|uniref:hypothetical protein n=1 Tax=Devosia rhizosphaerae TaxID=3049774 RepID=UPI00253FE0D9|nr:hypothetical protein [Devosia sp. RR2S18]WIJ25772.1 hypothetical protein QOV41_03140 [Devosia sp. RR2S18]
MSRLAELNKYEPVDEWDHEDPRNAVDQVIEPPVSPSTEGYVGYVFIDADRFSDDAVIDRILLDYQARFRREVTPKLLTRSSLEHWPFIAFPRAEKLFVKQGYVCEFELRKGGRGQKLDSLFTTAHKRAVHGHAILLDEVVSMLGPDFFGWQDELAAEGNREAARTLLTEKVSGALAPLYGEDDRGRYLLVEWEGLLLGRGCANDLDVIHPGFEGTPGSWVRKGRDAVAQGYFGGQELPNIRSQVKFELRADVCHALHNARHWPRAAQEQHVPVTPEMVMAWLSQWVATLRRIAWHASTNQLPDILTDGLLRERAQIRAEGRRRRPIGAGRLPNRPPAQDRRHALQTELEKMLDDIGGIGGRAATIEQIKIGLTTEDLIIGHLSGMTFDASEPDEPPEPLLMIAHWLGELRRQGHATLGGDFWDDFSEAEFQSGAEAWWLLQSVLPEGIWRELLLAAQEISRTDRQIDVRYEWTRNAEQPWAVARHADHLHIRGPLLHFPSARPQPWRAAANLLRTRSGFSAPPLPRARQG